jgi:hypothetical protein
MGEPPLYKRRWQLFLRQFAEDFGDGWQTELQQRSGVHQTAFGKQLKGVGPNIQTLNLAVDRLRIRREFFFDQTLAEPSYRDFLIGGSASAPRANGPARPFENRHWRRFLDLAGPARYGLSDEQIAWLQRAPFRGGPQSVDDYIAAAELIARRDMPQPDGLEKAREDEGR